MKRPTTQRHPWVPVCFVLLVTVAGVALPRPFVLAQQAPVVADWPKRSADDRRVEALVAHLGSKRFSEREVAVKKLRAIGIDAYPLLRRYIDSDDAEIRLRVRSLVDELRPKLIRMGLSELEQAFIADYLDLSKAKRMERINALGMGLAPINGTAALLRCALLEPDLRLAKAAAASIVAGGFPPNAGVKQRMQTQLAEALQSPAADSIIAEWLTEIQRSLNDPKASIDAFLDFATEERRLGTVDPAATDTFSILLPLEMYVLDLMVESGDDRADAYARKLFLRAKCTPSNGYIFLSSLFRRTSIGAAELGPEFQPETEMDQLFLAVADKDPAWFEENRSFQYVRAGLTRAVGAAEDADRFANEAFEASNGDDRAAVARWTSQMGLLDASEREWHQLTSRIEEEISDAAEAYVELSSALHQQGRDQEAADLLAEMHAKIEELINSKDYDGPDEVFPTEQYEATRLFYSGVAARKKGDKEAAKQHFRASISITVENSDVLCEAYKIEDDAWRDEIKTIRERAVAVKSDLLDRLMARQAQFGQKESMRPFVASTCNEIAWLLVSTGGNPNVAKQFAIRSLEAEPLQSHSIDTLATCYFELEQMEKAIEYERVAVQLAPHRSDLVRTLRRFMAAASPHDSQTVNRAKPSAPSEPSDEAPKTE